MLPLSVTVSGSEKLFIYAQPPKAVPQKNTAKKIGKTVNTDKVCKHGMVFCKYGCK